MLVFRQGSVFLFPYIFAAIFLTSKADSNFFFDYKLIDYILCFILVDFFVYALHVWSHKTQIGWTFHKLHHSGDDYNITTGFRTTVFSGIVNAFALIPVIALGFDKNIILFCFIINNLIQHITHFNFYLYERLNSTLDKCYVVSFRFHAIHHEKLEGDKVSNFGGVFNIWDKLFQTECSSVERIKTIKFGIANYSSSRNPILLFLEVFVDIYKVLVGRAFVMKNKYDLLTLFILLSAVWVMIDG